MQIYGKTLKGDRLSPIFMLFLTDGKGFFALLAIYFVVSLQSGNGRPPIGRVMV